jgi:penicillin G amidase
MFVATTAIPVTSARARRWVLTTAFILLLLAFVAMVTTAAWFYLLAHSSLPQLDGSISVPGLSARVTVIRDGHGVPTIEAGSLEDLFLAQGYVSAQDRLWQMDMIRRFAAGEISEILGADFLRHDREQRILGLRAAAQHAAQTSVSTRDRKYFAAYADGVNAFINAHRDHLPLEFRILHYAPRPWTVEDCILMGARMVEDLNHYPYARAVQREKILAKLGAELTADLYVNSSWRDHPPSALPTRMDQTSEDSDKDEGGGSIALANLTDPWPASPFPTLAMTDSVLTAGSNNWVVSGAHALSGKPLLSNDMHLTHQLPNLWYEAHLRSGQFDVVGVTLPGTPFVIVGHNKRIAWGFTNLGPTVEDVYIEHFNDGGQYLTPEGWRYAEHRQEVIHVKDKRDVAVDVVVTRHGPVISELVPGETRKLALRWTLCDSLHDPFFEINSAANWEEFVRALAEWEAPAQNVVYADVDGHIGYQATGRIPIRAAGDGSLPVEGSDNGHEWTGYVPFDKLPRVYDPPSGILATANGRITPDGYPYSLSTEWGSPWRTERIYRTLTSGKKFAAADMLALQTDVYSAFDRFCAERFVYALDHASNLSFRARQARELMRDWDGRFTVESAAATVESQSRRELVRLLLEPKLGSDSRHSQDGGSEEHATSWNDYRWFMTSVWLENVLLKQPQRWLPNHYENYDALLVASVETALRDPMTPADLSDWRWGTISRVDIEHPVLRQLPLVGRWTGPGVHEQSANGYTIKQVGHKFGPSERLTVDFADLDASTLNLVTGQAGNFLSPYYMDQWKAWYEGTTFPLPFSQQAVERTKQHELLLEPGK